MQKGTFSRIRDCCYSSPKQDRRIKLKRVNLLEYFELAESLHSARRALAAENLKGGNIWVNTYDLPAKLHRFIEDDNGFSTGKRAANELLITIGKWMNENLMDDNSPPGFSTEKFEQEFSSWQFGEIPKKIDAFKSVFAAECTDVDVYSVGQIAIYKTSALVSDGAGIIPPDVRQDVPVETLIEFNSAGRCLAFDLPTACGFHALRGLELVMDDYLKSFGIGSKKRTWNDYIKALTRLTEMPKTGAKPAPKVAAMLDRMRELERNPLMHPRDTLDAVQADMLFKLCAITVVEIAKDMKANKASGKDSNSIATNDYSGAASYASDGQATAS